MFFKRAVLERVADGSITLAFRRWRRPAVKPGGRLTTAIGMLAIEDVVPVALRGIAEAEARRAGYGSLAVLAAELAARTEGRIYRIALHPAGPDPRIALRDSSRIDAAAMAALEARLERLDRLSPWTRRTIALIARHPGRRAPALAAAMGMETAAFKARVRRLKALGLTESLAVGYRLSPRGKTLGDHLRKAGRRARKARRTR